MVTSASRAAASRWFRRARSKAGALQPLVGHLVFAAVMILVLRPTATLLPFARALSIARAFGYVNAVMPAFGVRKTRLIAHAFGPIGAIDALRLAAEHVARPLCDSVILRRALRGFPDRNHWRIEQRGRPCVDRVWASGETFILATAHFTRQAFMALAHREILPHDITSVSLPLPRRTRDPRTWWAQYHYGQILECSRASRPEIKFVYPVKSGAYRQLVETLRKPGNVVMVHIDAPATSMGVDTYCRPFAGLESRRFATGAARLSRVTGRPIVVCIPYLEDDRTIVLDWTRVIEPPEGGGIEADRRVTDTMLDDIERAIGRHPDQYLMDFLGTRRWDASAERWVT
jgi:lauroyl/myristoyl acyltransferase